MPEKVTVTLDREVAEILVLPEGHGRDDWEYWHLRGNAKRSIRAALNQEPQVQPDGLRKAFWEALQDAGFFPDGAVHPQVMAAFDATQQVQPDGGERDGAALIAAERRRQVEQEGWTPRHDDDHIDGELLVAAECYMNPGIHVYAPRVPMERWPWEKDAWKPCSSSDGPESMGKVTPADRIRNLTKAGALIAAEIDRLQRAALSNPDETELQGDGGKP